MDQQSHQPTHEHPYASATEESTSPTIGEDTTSDDLSDWAQQPPSFEHLSPSGMAHLPQAPLGMRVMPPSEGDRRRTTLKGATSKPFSLPLNSTQSSLSYSLARLLSYPRFVAFVSTPVGYQQFNSYLQSKPTTSSEATGSAASSSTAVSQLELWKDLRVLAQMFKQAGLAGKGISDVYLEPSSPSHVDLPLPLLKDTVDALMTATAGAPGLAAPAKHLLYSLYESEFEGFVKNRLLKHTKAVLSRYHLTSTEGADGIGSAFLLTNPRLPDDPIVLVSTGFCELTGYTPAQIIGRNCRFLQGSASAPASVEAIRQRLQIGEEVTQVVLNYKADGSPFLCLVNIIPLRDLAGNLTYFVGGQTDVTRAVTTGSDLSFILTGDEPLTAIDITSFSPAVQLEANAAQQSILGSAPGAGPDLTLVKVPDLPTTKPLSRTESAPVGGGKDGKEKGIGFHRLFSAALRRKRTQSAMKRAKTETIDESEALHVPPTQKAAEEMPLEKRIADVQSTYERLLVVKRQGRQILFCTSGFLRFCGLPGTSVADISASPLVHRDLLTLIVDPAAPSSTSRGTKELRKKLATAISDAVTMSIPAAVQLRFEDPSGRVESLPTAHGRLHIAPLLDLMGECSACTVVLG